MKYSEILKENNSLSDKLDGKQYNILVLSNIIVSQIKDVLEYYIRLEGINAFVTLGNYDNIVQDSIKIHDFDLTIVCWELSNLIDGLQYKSNLYSDGETRDLVNKVKAEIDLLFQNSKRASLLAVNKFSSLVFSYPFLDNNNFDFICDELNTYLVKRKNQNTILINIDKVIAKISIEKSIDSRFFYSSKSPYSIEFFKEYSSHIKPIILSANGAVKKALILDCDNTLWKGILGEDGIENLEYTSETPDGTVFEEIQSMVMELSKRGVIIGLCSKNNLDDVNDFFRNNKKLSLKTQNITIKKVNWKDKVSNLREIASELNIGLDSIVFLDDSDFEINLVKENIPEICCIQVPKKLYTYPSIFRNNSSCFFSLSRTEEDAKKLQMYKQQTLRHEQRIKHSSLEDYLESLTINVAFYINEIDLVPRMSQMTQKTNQFNLTTKRYTESDIETFVRDSHYITIAISVRDKYGDSGITGLSILQLDGSTATVDTFLLSCRIIGRNIEFSFFDYVVQYLAANGIETILGSYRKTPKNQQVSNFYNSLNFIEINSLEEVKKYKCSIENYHFKNLNYIGTTNG